MTDAATLIGASDSIPEFKPKAGMFGGGKFGWKEAIAFGLAGFMARRNPALLQGLMRMMAQKNAMQQRQQEYERGRQDKRDDFLFEQNFKLAHPTPPNNDTVADFNFITSTLGADAGKRFLETKTNPIVMTPYGPMPYSQVIGGNRPAVGSIVDDPRKGGAGAAVPPPGF